MSNRTAQPPAEIAFPAGRLVMTCGVQALVHTGLDIHTLLQRHLLGDDGEVCPEDRQANIFARINGERVVSVYKNAHPEAPKIYIITEWDRSYTTVMLAEEY